MMTKSSDGSIAELRSLSNEDAEYRIRERMLNMYERLGDVKKATEVLWNDLRARS